MNPDCSSNCSVCRKTSNIGGLTASCQQCITLRIGSKALHLIKFVNLHPSDGLQTYLASAGLRSSSLAS